MCSVSQYCPNSLERLGGGGFHIGFSCNSNPLSACSGIAISTTASSQYPEIRGEYCEHAADFDMPCDTLKLRGRERSSITVELRKRVGHSGRRTTINRVLRQVPILAWPYNRNIVK